MPFKPHYAQHRIAIIILMICCFSGKTWKRYKTFTNKVILLLTVVHVVLLTRNSTLALHTSVPICMLVVLLTRSPVCSPTYKESYMWSC